MPTRRSSLALARWVLGATRTNAYIALPVEGYRIPARPLSPGKGATPCFRTSPIVPGLCISMGEGAGEG